MDLVYGALFGNNSSISCAVSRKQAAVWRAVNTLLFSHYDNTAIYIYMQYAVTFKVCKNYNF